MKQKIEKGGHNNSGHKADRSLRPSDLSDDQFD